MFICLAEGVGHEDENIKKEDGSSGVKLERDHSSTENVKDKKDGHTSSFKSEKETMDAHRVKEIKIAESEIVRDLKSQLKYVVIATRIIYKVIRLIIENLA